MEDTFLIEPGPRVERERPVKRGKQRAPVCIKCFTPMGEQLELWTATSTYWKCMNCGKEIVTT